MAAIVSVILLSANAFDPTASWPRLMKSQSTEMRKRVSCRRMGVSATTRWVPPDVMSLTA